MQIVKKCGKALMSLLLIVGLMTVSGAFASCNSSKSTMYKNKKYSQNKTVKTNIKVKGTNKKNGSTYRSY